MLKTVTHKIHWDDVKKKYKKNKHSFKLVYAKEETKSNFFFDKELKLKLKLDIKLKFW